MVADPEGKGPQDSSIEELGKKLRYLRRQRILARLLVSPLLISLLAAFISGYWFVFLLGVVLAINNLCWHAEMVDTIRDELERT